MVGEQVAASAARVLGALVPEQRIVGPGVTAVDVAAQQRAGGVIFGDQGVAVVEELGRCR